ncbi:MAG TPA: SUMF1/EgtB/PvdO family nonheme iron enzyme [Chitinophagales bacterium]|nr:SUMF1/EgtB/PvdO family nonheme iron enzyme [Chitinophagales bacterium]
MGSKSIFAGVVLLSTICFVACESTARILTKDGRTNTMRLISTNGVNLIKLTNNLYAGQCEITNGDYKVFLKAIARDPQRLCANMVDTSVWAKYKYAEPLVKHYWQWSEFNDYPVVGITWQAANDYCRWLSEQSDVYSYRLPTEQEWKLMVAEPNAKGMDLPCPDGYSEEYGAFCFNFWAVDSMNNTACDGGYFTVRADAYWTNINGFLNLHGNVAEMTGDNNVCKGGGWYDKYEDCSMYTQKQYTLPSAEVGFRVVATKRF